MKISIKILLFLVIVFNYSCDKTEIDKYNYIVIFTDDMGYGDIGVYGHPTINTPYLDKMSVEGQKWTQVKINTCYFLIINFRIHIA